MKYNLIAGWSFVIAGLVVAVWGIILALTGGLTHDVISQVTRAVIVVSGVLWYGLHLLRKAARAKKASLELDKAGKIDGLS